MAPYFNVISSTLFLIFALNGDPSRQLLVDCLPTHGTCAVRSSSNSIDFRSLSLDNGSSTTCLAGKTSADERKGLSSRSPAKLRRSSSLGLKSFTHLLCMVNPVQSCSVRDIEVPRDPINGTAQRMQRILSMIRDRLSIQGKRIISLFPPSYAALPAG